MHIPKSRISFLTVVLALLAGAPAHAQPAGAEADEPAIWSALADRLAARYDRLAVSDSAFFLSILIGDPPGGRVAARMEYVRFDSTAIEDFIARNRDGVRISATLGRNAAVRLRRVPPPSADDDEIIGHGEPVVYLSRVGFDRTRSRAVVLAAVFCGLWCSEGHVAELERGPDGAWRVARIESVWVA